LRVLLGRYLANAFGVSAARKLYSVRYIRLPDLLGELAIARAEGTYRKIMKGFKQVNLLILDEWLLYPLKDAEAREVLEIAEARYKKASTIFCSQFDIGGWHQKITAKANGLKPFDYLKLLFEALPNSTSSQLPSLLLWGDAVPDGCRVL
jgi:DNA replication protein DnaC